MFGVPVVEYCITLIRYKIMISDFDVEELIRGLGNLDDDVDVDEYIYDNFGVEFDSFVKIIETLMPLIVMGQSPLTQKVYKGFGKDGVFFIKQEAD